MEPLTDLTTRIEQNSKRHALVAWVRGLAAAGPGQALEAIEQRYGARSRVVEQIKAAVDPHTSGNTSALAPTRLWSQFLEGVEDRLLPKLAGARRAPFRVRVGSVTSPAVAGWLSNSRGFPATAIAVDDVQLEPLQVGTIVGISRELARSAAPEASGLIERDLSHACATLENDSLLGDAAAVADERPAGLLNGVTPISTGSPEQAEDLLPLWRSVRSGEPVSPVYITSPSGAMFLASLRDSGGPLHPNVGPLGGRRTAG